MKCDICDALSLDFRFDVVSQATKAYYRYKVLIVLCLVVNYLLFTGYKFLIAQVIHMADAEKFHLLLTLFIKPWSPLFTI